MSFDTAKALTTNDMEAVNAVILDRLKSDVVLINQVGHYIIGAGGKRLRPMLAVLTANALGYQGDKHHLLAAIIEFIHTATLLHDDVVDESDMRRGRETANNLFGNQASVLVGDFLYTRSFEMMCELDSMDLMNIMSNTTRVIAEGEVLQLMNCNDPDTTEAAYMDVIYFKTGKLFEAAGRAGALVAGADKETQEVFGEYAKQLGVAFQLVDDLLDYEGDAAEIGKNVGDDLAEGKPTLPLIYAMKNASEAEANVIREAIENGGIDKIDEITQTIRSCGALDYTRNFAQSAAESAKQALTGMPENEFVTALKDLADFSVARTF